VTQADKYFETFFEYFEIIAKSPFSFESVDYIKIDYRRFVCGFDSIYYKIPENNIVEIMAIIGKQDLQNILYSEKIQLLNNAKKKLLVKAYLRNPSQALYLCFIYYI
jgi:toxin ParE1/3/4